MYTEFYGLTSLPFRLSPDPEFYFGSKGHDRALAYLRYGLAQKEGFIVVTGLPGTGKTTLARALLAEIGREKIVVAELNTTHLQAEDVLRIAAASFGLPHENMPKASLLKRLQDFFLSKHRAGYHCLLLIDEAQNLPNDSLEELRMLSNFYSGKDALLQIFLLGQQQFRDIMQTPEMEQLRQRVVAATHLEPLSLSESQQYIEHRLKIAGWQERPVITPKAFELIYALTRGVPRRINTFCDRLFLYGSLEELYEIDADAVRTVGRELMLETDAKTEARKVEAKSTASSNEKNFSEYAKTELTSAFDSSLIEEEGAESKEEAQSTPPPPRKADLRLVEKRGNTMQVVEPKVETVPDAKDLREPRELVAFLKSLLNGKAPELPQDELVPEYMGQVLSVAVGKIQFTHLDGEYVSDAQRAKLIKRIRDYLKDNLLAKSCDYYRRLAVLPDASLEHIKRHYRYLFRLFQPGSGKLDDWDDSYTRRINQAYATLRDPEGRSRYDQFLKSVGKISPPKEQELDMPTVEAKPQDVSPNVVNDMLPPVPGEELDESPPIPVQLDSEIKKNSTAQWSLALLVVIGVLLGGLYFAKPELFTGMKGQIKRELSLDVAGLKNPDVTNVPLSESPAPIELPTVEAPKLEDFPKPPQETPAIQSEITTIPEQKPVKTEPVKKAPVVAAMQKTPTRPVEKQPTPKVEAKVLAQAPLTPSASVNAEKPTTPKVEKKALPKPVALQDIERLMEELRVAYDAGSLEMFMNLFAADARTNDSVGRDLIRADYQSLFGSTRFRRFELSNMNWQRDIDGARGKGNFKVIVMRKQASNMKTFEGKVEIAVRKVEDALRISEFHYFYK